MAISSGGGDSDEVLSEINITPMLDLAYVLLVIFIITAPLMVSAVKVNLPQAQGGQALNASQFIAVSVDPAGQVYVNEQPLDQPAIGKAFEEAAQRNPQTEVQLRADSTVPYGQVVELMGLAQKAGLSKIGFVAEPRPTAAP